MDRIPIVSKSYVILALKIKLNAAFEIKVVVITELVVPFTVS